MAEPILGKDGKFYDLTLDPDADVNTLSFIAKPSDNPPKQPTINQEASNDTTAVHGLLERSMMQSIHSKAFNDTAGDTHRKTFDGFGLPEPLLRALSLLNFRWPSRIQSRTIPVLLGNPPRNLLGQSQSGTGKTAAFVIAMLTRIDVTENSTQGLVLAPTRELARQIMGVIQGLGQYMDVKTQFAIPAMYDRGKRFEAHIVVGAPGTTLDCVRRGTLDLGRLRMLVIDEADNMLDLQGLGEQCIRIKSTIRHSPQILLWSATFPQRIVEFSKRYAPDCLTMTLEHHELTVTGIKQMYMDCVDAEAKFGVLVQLYHVLTIGSSIIFVHQRHDATRIAERMALEGHKISVLHSALENGGVARDKVIDDFRSGRTKVLITTNVLARGIDVSTVSMVVNYDLPMDKDRNIDFPTYLHRIGRTGRFGRIGVSISFVHDKTSWAQLMEVSEHFGVTISKVPTDDIEVGLHFAHCNIFKVKANFTGMIGS
ncbi:DEAD-domain-containing protein [Choiromyces venosus 120613-1]|uniref:RNA helicase n=1 Tax=Choiromyces venosus 120613-1 TaxID=1336337 RepID=A0A3N4JJL8_9PEZI|nr:DEAD-domain-containing protein [Choiromyces venosus 120613-1]